MDLTDLFLGERGKRKLFRDWQLRCPDVLLHMQVSLPYTNAGAQVEGR